MKMVYCGKTKDVYECVCEGEKLFTLKFKDDVTGKDGVFDPGENQVGAKIEGMGKGGIKLTEFFFKKISNAGIPTHYVSSDVEKSEMVVKPATIFGKGLEVICRYMATGSFVRRYGLYCSDGMPLDALVEITIKDDERQDPLITKDSLALLGILSHEEHDTLVSLTKKICGIIKDELKIFGLELADIKLEFGRSNGEILLIDEISAGNMRVFKDGRLVEPLELVELVTKS